jgi:hypothetical protein
MEELLKDYLLLQSQVFSYRNKLINMGLNGIIMDMKIEEFDKHFNITSDREGKI